MNTNIDVNDPKIVELSFHVLEKIIMKCDGKDLKETMEIAKIMENKAQEGDYPEELKYAYSDALNKLGTLNDDLLSDLREMLKNDE